MVPKWLPKVMAPAPCLVPFWRPFPDIDLLMQFWSPFGVARCALHVACCTLHVARCALHVACSCPFGFILVAVGKLWAPFWLLWVPFWLHFGLFWLYLVPKTAQRHISIDFQRFGGFRDVFGLFVWPQTHRPTKQQTHKPQNQQTHKPINLARRNARSRFE